MGMPIANFTVTAVPNKLVRVVQERFEASSIFKVKTNKKNKLMATSKTKGKIYYASKTIPNS